jgi:hypothetical protein
MEGWSRSQTGALNCLPIAKVAERPTREHDRSTRQLTRGNSNPRSALPIAKVDAGCKNTPVDGEVFLDTLLYGSDSRRLIHAP